MTESPDEVAVEQLLAESDAIRGWLTRLADGPTSVPDSVRQRVRGDYQRRLDDVTAGLRAHADLIASRLHADRTEHAELQSRANSAREALAEAELRHLVGEYDSARFESERRRHDSDIESCQVTLGAVSERIARLEEINALVLRAPRPLAIAIEPELPEPVAAPEVRPFTPVEPEPVSIRDLAPDATAGHGSLDGPTADGFAPDGAAAPIPDSGPLSFRPSGNGPEIPRAPAAPPVRARPFESAPPLGIPGADVPPRFVRPGEVLAKQPAPPAVAVPPAVTAEPAPAAEANAAPVGRTLRCGECGAMNRPLEWYCEKCGAELTAV